MSRFGLIVFVLIFCTPLIAESSFSGGRRRRHRHHRLHHHLHHLASLRLPREAENGSELNSVVAVGGVGDAAAAFVVGDLLGERDKQRLSILDRKTSAAEEWVERRANRRSTNYVNLWSSLPQADSPGTNNHKARARARNCRILCMVT